MMFFPDTSQTQRYCPGCGSSDIAEIIFGLIDLSKYEKEIEEKRVTYAGNNLWDDGPHWLCNECHTAWCKSSNHLYQRDEFGDFNLLDQRNND